MEGREVCSHIFFCFVCICFYRGKHRSSEMNVPYLPPKLPCRSLYAYRKMSVQSTSLTWWLLFSCSVMSDSFVNPMDCSPSGSSVHGFPRPKYWSGLPCPPPGDLPDPGTEPVSPALAGRFFTTMPPEKPRDLVSLSYFNSLWKFETEIQHHVSRNLSAKQLRGCRSRYIR